MNKIYLWGKRFFLLQCLFLLAIASANAQSNFKYQNPKPIGSTYFQISFFDNNNGIAVGNANTIARTTDGGTTWASTGMLFAAADGTKIRPVLNDVHFVTASVAYAVGANGLMLKSVDAGVTWAQVNNPLYNIARSINAVYFLNKDTGYIGGQALKLSPYVADDSINANASPKLYFTKNGGATWDSIAAPYGSTITRAGQYASAVNAQATVKLHATGTEIFRIRFSQNGIGYIVGSPNSTYSQPYPGGTSTLAGSNAPIVWKLQNGVLTDYSLSKEKFGFSGVNTNAPTATTTLNNPGVCSNLYKTLTVLSDSLILLTSWNNAYAVRIKTGVDDSTGIQFVNVSGTAPAVTYSSTGIVAYAKGKYEIIQGAYPSQTFPAVTQPYTSSLAGGNIQAMMKAADGKIYVPTNLGRVYVTANNGTSWTQMQAIATSFNFSGNQLYGGDITANGKLHAIGQDGVYINSADGNTWAPNYLNIQPPGSLLGTPPIRAPNAMQFADCNNGIIMGSAGLLLATTNGGATWVNKSIASFTPNTSIFGMSYPDPARLYFTASNGNVYFSNDMGTSNNVIFIPNMASVCYGIDTWGTGATTRIWAAAVRSSAPLEKLVVYRSLNNGISWDTIKTFIQGTPAGSTPYIKFASQDTGYLSTTKGAVYKTTDGGTTWVNITPMATTTGTINSKMGVLDKNNIWWATIDNTASPSQPRFLYKSTDGGATWSANLYPANINGETITANITDFAIHDANNVVLIGAGDKLIITNDGGATWRTDQSPSAGVFTTGVFVPKAVPAGTPMSNRKLVTTATSQSVGGLHIFEYGVATSVHVTSTELIAGASCTAPNSGSITITATGAIAPYMYKLGTGAYQSSNVFSGLAAGTYTITIKDASCDSLVKTVIVTTTDDQILNTNIATATICAGGTVQLIASGNSASYSWSPTTGLSNPNIANPVASPTTTTTYVVTGTLNSCTKTRSITVNVNPNPSLVIIADPGTTLCEGDPTLLTVVTGTVTPVGTLYTQTGTAGGSPNSQAFEPANAAFNNQAAEDFVVPAGSSWTITQVSAAGLFFNGAGPSTSFNVFFYNNAVGNIPGTVVASYTNLAYTGGANPVITIPNTVLAAGIYWVSIQSNMSFTVGGQWAWGAAGTTATGNPWAWQNPNGGFGICTTWGNGAATCNPGTGANLLFTLTGTSLVGGAPLPAGYTFLWSPAAGLSSTTSNPVAASPMNTTTYSVVASTSAGCVGNAQITITVNKRPVVTIQPVNKVSCAGTAATFTVGGTGTGLTYQWQVSTTGCAGPWVNLNNGTPYTGVTNPTLNVSPVTTAMTGFAYRCIISGTCAPVNNANISNCATLTVNPLPVVSVTPTVSCGSSANGCNAITASGADTYTWSPITGLFLDCAATVPYTGSNTATVYARPTTFTIYTVTGTLTTTGCSNTAQTYVNYTPPAPTVTPASVTMCLGEPAVRITSSSSTSTSTTVSATTGSINIPIPDGTGAAATSTLNIAGVPTGPGVSIGEIKVTMNVNHTWVGDVDANIKAPNGAVLNLVGGLDGGTGGNGTDNFTSTVFSSLSSTPISGALAPRTGLFGAEGRAGFGPTGFIQTVPTFAGLVTPTAAAANGTWTLAVGDFANTDIGAITSWSLDITYIVTVGVPSTSATWSPIAGLYTDANATIAYTGTPRDTVWTRPTPSGVYPYQVTVQSLPAPPVPFTNPAVVTIPVGGTGTPYPSNLTISGLPTTGVTVKSIVLNSINHTWGEDVDVLIQSPTGTNVVLMSDVGGTAGFNATYTFADSGTPMSITGANATGTYKPTNNGATDNFPAPGPGSITQATPTIASLIGNMNGVWKLFAVDDDGLGDQGSIAGGFTINFDLGILPCTSPARTVVVTVNQPTVLNAQLPANQIVCTDKVATFTASVTAGTGPHSYQWQVSTTGTGGTFNNITNGGVYSGATTATLTITAPPISMSGYAYRAIVNGAAPCASQTSRAATLTVNALPSFSISVAPSTSLLPGMQTTLSASAITPPATPFVYSWIRNGVVLTSPALGVVSGLNTANLTVDVDGMGDYQLRVTDANGCTATASQTITIRDSASAKCYIYPNPTNGIFQVRYYSNAGNNILPRTLTVYDAKGNRVLTQTYPIGRPYDRMDVDMRVYGKGLYWVEIGDRNGNRLTMCRVAIQ